MTELINDRVDMNMNVNNFIDQDMVSLIYRPWSILLFKIASELAVLNKTELAMLIEQEPELSKLLNFLSEQKKCDFIASQTASCEQRELYHNLMGPG